jgi:hypothetical protein
LTVLLRILSPGLAQVPERGLLGVAASRFFPKGDVMEMEVIPIVPDGKTEMFQFKRAQFAAR